MDLVLDIVSDLLEASFGRVTLADLMKTLGDAWSAYEAHQTANPDATPDEIRQAVRAALSTGGLAGPAVNPSSHEGPG